LSGASQLPGRSRLLVPAVLFVLGVLGVLFVTACGGGGGGGGGPTAPNPPPPPPPGITFTSAGVAGANSLALASGTGTTATTLFLELRANQVTDLYGVAFDLTYPSAQLQFTRVTAGPLLAGGAVQASATAPGTLVVGGTHLGNVPGASGSGVVLTLEFNAVTAGSGSFTFSRNSALSSHGQPITGISWVAGSVQVNR
jgi:cohesin domain-containing protein